MDFGNKTALITGGAKGIGRAAALKMASLGARVAVTDIDEKALGEVESELGEGHLTLRCDVADEASVRDTVKRVEEAFGCIDILVNNAGIFKEGVAPFVEQTPEIWKRKIDINIWGVLYMTSAVLPGMYSRGYGKIVNVGSVAATYGIINMVDYSMTKGAVVSFTAGLAREAIQHGVYVNCVSPGNIASTDVNNQPALAYIGRSGSPEECANVILFLASDDASYVSGVNYIVDGCRKKI